MTKKIALNCKTIAPNGSIAGVGGIDLTTQTQVHLTEAEAIVEIDAGRVILEVHGHGFVATVRVAHHGGHRFLETHRDGTKCDNLESLEVCRHQRIHTHPTPPPVPYRPVPVHRGHCVVGITTGKIK